LSHLTSFIPTKPNLYPTNSLVTVLSDPDLYKHFTFHVPNLMPLFHCLDCTKGFVQPRGNYDHFVTKPVFMVRSCYQLALPQARGPRLVGSPRMLIQCICSYPPYWRPFLHLQPRDMPCDGDRYRLVMDINELSNCQLLVCARLPQKFPCVHDL